MIQTETFAEKANSLAPPAAMPTSPRVFSWTRVRQFGSSLADQGFALGGMFLANIVLARSRTKEEYGTFALSYSVFIFLSGLHNAAILEPYTIHGPGRYYRRFTEYSILMSRNNVIISGGLSIALLLIWAGFRWGAPGLATRSFLGLALTAGILLTSLFVRRTLYLRKRPDLAARVSSVFFAILVALLLVSKKFEMLNGFSLYLIVAGAWIVGGLSLGRELPSMQPSKGLTALEPDHWAEHWKYARWVLATAMVFQFTTQGYYWLLAAFISVKDVAELRAMYILVGLVDQVGVALTLLILPVMAFRFASSQYPQLVSLWKSFGLLNLAFTLGYALIIGFLGRPLMHVVYSGKFDDIAGLLRGFALLPVIMGIGNSVNVALKSIERPDIVLWAYLASGAATFLLGVPLIMHFGLQGAVYGMLVSAAAYTITMAVALPSSVRSKLGSRAFLFATPMKKAF